MSCRASYFDFQEALLKIRSPFCSGFDKKLMKPLLYIILARIIKRMFFFKYLDLSKRCCWRIIEQQNVKMCSRTSWCPDRSPNLKPEESLPVFDCPWAYRTALVSTAAQVNVLQSYIRKCIHENTMEVREPFKTLHQLNQNSSRWLCKHMDIN